MGPEDVEVEAIAPMIRSSSRATADNLRSVLVSVDVRIPEPRTGGLLVVELLLERIGAARGQRAVLPFLHERRYDSMS